MRGRFAAAALRTAAAAARLYWNPNVKPYGGYTSGTRATRQR